MAEILSFWRSPLDTVGLVRAEALSANQLRCSIGYGTDFSLMTVYNFGHYVVGAPTADAALTDMINAIEMGLSSVPGGLAFIPQQSFAVHALSYPVPDQCSIVGSGGGGTPGTGGGSAFYHFAVTPSGSGSSVFLDCSPSPLTSGGIYLRSLAFQWAASTQFQDTCIHANAWNVRAINCTFTDCPRAFNAVALACALEQCTINYNVAAELGPNGTTAVALNAPECAVVGPGQFSQTSQSAGGATGCACIGVYGSSEHAIIADMQLYEWAIGVDFSQDVGSIYTHIRNCEIESWQNAVNIQLPKDAGAGNITTSVKVTSCTLAKASDSTNGGPVVNIDAQLAYGNDNGQLNDITLLDCTVFNMAVNPPAGQHGVVVAGGQNIKIIGGTYSNNSSSGGAGVAITGACGDVQIIGANLQPSYPGAPYSNSQQYALLIGADPVGAVLLSGCDMTGYTTPVKVTVSPSNLRIANCPGYNDQNTILNVLPSQLTAGINAASLTDPYFGPSVFTYSSGTPVTLNIFGQTITSASGIVFLPSAYDTFSFTSAPALFSWIGK